ncbi:YlzJ-like family protein [Paenactinomyces guangxiensis]|uniref:YlzJ-like family protein n=1 Tax=Paenactinomyces guangxiensis TaxID=1490290 RepID=A0A7W1WQU6_9BACL|nr:YlzJ-like family protein [Paenactinomyces guangxiensis]MBA4494393.1 YlzJ-like family protein [Paenactinomyces guangxiensis]MBH8591552.1 YlzJ-like family protein [Paenactinomyces guangxiensis]
MIHYTVLPEELIFYDSNQKALPLKEVVIDGIQMLIQLDGSSEATIVRLLSPDPMHYLDSRFQPGNKLQLFPKI